MPTQFPFAVDQGASPPGTSLQASFENALAFAQSMLLTRGVPALPGVSLTLTQPATTIIYNDGSANLRTVSGASTSITALGTQDNYIEMKADGTYQNNHVTNNNPRPGLMAGSVIQLYVA